MVAVLFINDGWQTGGSVQRFFDTTFRPFADAHIYIAALEQHPTKVLCDLVQSHGCHELTFEKQTLSKDSTTCNSRGTACTSTKLMLTASQSSFMETFLLKQMRELHQPRRGKHLPRHSKRSRKLPGSWITTVTAGRGRMKGRHGGPLFVPCSRSSCRAMQI
jgi:hypothetical protein